MYNLAKKDNSDIVICDMRVHYQNGTKKNINCTKYDSVYTVAPSASNKLFKNTIIKDLTFITNKWYEDFNFTTKILLKQPKISVISEPYYNYFMRDLSTMNNNNSIKNLDILYIIDDLITYAKENNLYDENIFKYLIFDHVLIATIIRVAFQKNDDSKKVITLLRQYCHANLKNYKKYDFYKMVPIQRKIISFFNYHSLHNISKFLLKTKAKFVKK